MTHISALVLVAAEDVPDLPRVFALTDPASARSPVAARAPPGEPLPNAAIATFIRARTTPRAAPRLGGSGSSPVPGCPSSSADVPSPELRGDEPRMSEPLGGG